MEQIQTNHYYDEFLRYYELAIDQQGKTNLGWQDPANSTIDPLMNNVYLYDVVERGLAGFSQIIHDCFHGSSADHPYYEKMKHKTPWVQRQTIIKSWDHPRKHYGFVEWLYIFMVHRITGSAINYATIPSGYHNTILFVLHEGRTIEEMAEIIRHYDKPMFTSVGYQIAAFPRVPEGHKHVYDKAGKYWMCEILPVMITDFARHLEKSGRLSFREMMSYLEEWNKSRGYRVFWFQYAAFLADIADWFPDAIYKESMFFYGTNAVECISYLAEKPRNMKKEDFLDAVMNKACKDVNGYAYNVEDVCCDFIRYVENYVSPSKAYSHLDLDTVFNTCNIKDHPYGRQEAMLRLGLVESFNDYNKHVSDDFVLKMNNLDPTLYKEQVKQIDWNKDLHIKPKTQPHDLKQFFG